VWLPALSYPVSATDFCPAEDTSQAVDDSVGGRSHRPAARDSVSLSESRILVDIDVLGVMTGRVGANGYFRRSFSADWENEKS